MDENDLLDDLLPGDLEGLLFSDEYADADDNTSLISEIADAEITNFEKTAENVASDDGVGSSENDEKEKTQNANSQENAFDVEKAEDFFLKGFDFCADEKVHNLIKDVERKKTPLVEREKAKPFAEPKIAEKKTDFMKSEFSKPKNVPKNEIERTTPNCFLVGMGNLRPLLKETKKNEKMPFLKMQKVIAKNSIAKKNSMRQSQKTAFRSDCGNDHVAFVKTEMLSLPKKKTPAYDCMMNIFNDKKERF